MHVRVVGKSGKLLKTKEKFPYLNSHAGMNPEFYLAGVWECLGMILKQNDTTDTFAITFTTEANLLMKQIHNSQERMPTILPGSTCGSLVI